MGINRGGGAHTRVLCRSEAKLDDGARVGNEFGLPAIIFLKLLHGGFSLRVPVTRRFAGKITGLDERSLNLRSAGVIDSALTRGFR